MATSAPETPAAAENDRPIPVATKVIYSLGDHTVNIALTALSLLYLRFLIDEAGLRPALAGAVPWIGRAVDAFTDPIMGRISDLTKWRCGRRRPYLLLGAIPFGLFFALLWTEAPFDSQLGRFAYYAAVYVLLSVSMTVVSVPYLSLIPEMARDYDERTSLNTYRAAAAILGVFVTVGMSLLARSLGDDAAAYSRSALLVGIWLAAPWFAVWAVTWERPVGKTTPMRLWDGLRALAGHATYRTLSLFYITGRIAIDVVTAMFIFYVTWVIGRREDFEPIMFTFLSAVVLSLPLWLRLTRHFDKRSVFIAGVLWWIAAQLVLFAGGPHWGWLVFAIAAFAGVGYAVADLMPWAMLPDVTDEDQLRTGERREGLYYGTFTFVRKLGGATAVLLIGFVLDLSGYDGDAEQQSESAIFAIRCLMGLVPVALLAVTAWIARNYRLTREAHREILTRLSERQRRA